MGGDGKPYIQRAMEIAKQQRRAMMMAKPYCVICNRYCIWRGPDGRVTHPGCKDRQPTRGALARQAR